MRKTKVQIKPCEWCSTPLAAETCTVCGATAPKAALEVPGLTFVSEALRAVDQRISQHAAALANKRIVRFLDLA